MSDMDRLLAGLDDEREQADTEPHEAEARSRESSQATQPEEADEARSSRSDPRGKRADPDYVQVNANIPRELRASLFFYVKAEGRTLSGVIEELLEQYVEERGGLLGRKK